MKLSVKFSDKYDEILKELASCTGFNTVKEFVESEINLIIEENLDDYGYEKNGKKVYKNNEDILLEEEDSLNTYPDREPVDYLDVSRIL